MKRWLLLPLLLAIGLATFGCRDRQPAISVDAGTAKQVARTVLTLAERFPAGKNCTVEALKAAVAPHKAAITHCFRHALSRNPDAGGRLELRIQVSDSGEAVRVEAMPSRFDDERATACIADVLRNIPYAPSPAESPCFYVYPLDLTAADAAREQSRHAQKKSK